MIIFLQTILLSLVQAATEFLPISSSGHLILFHSFLNSDILNSLAFDVVLHGGSLLAIIIFFWRDIKEIWFSLKKDIKNKNLKNDLFFIIVISIIPAGLIGFFGEEQIDFLRKPIVVAGALIFGSILFFIAEKFFKSKKNLINLNIRDGITIGVMQCLALIPGISRSGITIVAGMNRGLSRVEAAKFSFLLAIPLLGGAFIKKTVDVFTSTASFNFYFVFGFFFTFIFSLIAIKFLMRLLKSQSGLYSFAVYRIVISIIIIMFLLN